MTVQEGSTARYPKRYKRPATLLQKDSSQGDQLQNNVEAPVLQIGSISIAARTMFLADCLRSRHYRGGTVTVICLGMILVTFTLKSSSRSRTQLNEVQEYKRRVAELEIQLEQALKQIPFSTTSTTTPKPCRDDFKEIFEREKRYICSHVQGGLGNFMFAYASVYGMASKVNKSVVIQKDNPLLKYFRVKANVVNDLCICNTAKFVNEGRHCQFNKDLLNLSENTNYRPGWYFQSWMYFRHVAEEIRQQFKFKDDVRQKAISLIKGSREAFVNRQRGSDHDNVTIVGVHVRKGDITKNKQFVAYGYTVASPQYFSAAMTYYRNKYNRTLFLVCSDHVTWCKENINGSDVMFMEDNSFEVDLAILAHCNHSIMSVGTFGWWASFLAGGETIYYKHPARNGSSLRKQFSKDYSDFFYPGWIGME
ncbi:galactoside alpha-(1,2)-fucosyltransferase 2-like isoform X1 [Haliotis rufescens]|uniref:galactoside alpha-(1,2)-fucosyltransferase 2-like isoform X1 n=2 Tax=Haliotis rufescens TaxID=6454 RepID=UPI00201F4BC2|nr:galactoside alpha-(1,2)-fucosyltransferase 2-like isoform X1 [Haliotis rufescens]